MRIEGAMLNAGIGEIAQCSNQRLTVSAKNEGRKSQIIQNYSSVETGEKKMKKICAARFSRNFSRAERPRLPMQDVQLNFLPLFGAVCIEV